MRNAAFCITGLALQGLSMSLMAQTDKPNIANHYDRSAAC